MDAPGATKAVEGANMVSSERDTSPARSRPPSNTNPDEHEEHPQESDDGSEGSEEQVEEEEEEYEEESDEEDEEPRLKYSYLTKHLGSVYRNGDATSTFLVAGDKMVGVYPGPPSISSANGIDIYRSLERTMESLYVNLTAGYSRK